MDFRLQRGQRCLIRIDERESEAVKIAVPNLAVDLEKTLGIAAQICRVKGKPVTEPEMPDAVAAEPERAETAGGLCQRHHTGYHLIYRFSHDWLPHLGL